MKLEDICIIHPVTEYSEKPCFNLYTMILPNQATNIYIIHPDSSQTNFNVFKIIQPYQQYSSLNAGFKACT